MNESPRKPGRPKAPEPSSSVSTWLRVSEYDRLARVAKERELSVSALVRSIVVPQLKT